ncbi:hypothetical protein [Mitsuaria sp. 7]|uniref:hypothetical protein n=1 Tax=Mitsuaria sp. 7 TaxID=1658665 RepID=UPI0012FC84A7|nr:hypothetical protein [Mitsuaria sp. 7]
MFTDPGYGFTTTYGEELLDRFERHGYELHLWRGTCPNNVFLADAHGGNELAVSGKDVPRGWAEACPATLMDFLPISRRKKIPFMASGSFGRDGAPRALQETYVFCPERAVHSRTLWAQRLAEVQQSRDIVEDRCRRRELLAGLGGRALALLKSMKRRHQQRIYPFEELSAEIELLRAREAVIPEVSGRHFQYRLNRAFDGFEFWRAQSITFDVVN